MLCGNSAKTEDGAAQLPLTPPNPVQSCVYVQSDLSKNLTSK